MGNDGGGNDAHRRRLRPYSADGETSMSSLIHCILAGVLLYSVGGSQESSSPISSSYSLDYESLEQIGRPRFTPRPAAPIPQPRTRFTTKRANSNLFISNTTTSFVIYLTCNSVTEFQCKQTLHHLSRAATRIERVVHLPEQVYINASFYPFCKSKLDCEDSSVLGQAAPNSWYLFADDGTQSNVSLPKGVDPDYAYPSALVRQWLPKDPALSKSFPDIGASFNSEVNWWFSSAFGPDDKGMPQQGQFGPITSNLNSTLKSYDFEQVVMHCLFFKHSLD